MGPQGAGAAPLDPARRAAGPGRQQAQTNDIAGLATRLHRYGYRRITAPLKGAGLEASHQRVERIWRREGLKVPPWQPGRGSLWLNDRSSVRLRPERRNHFWACDFVQDRTRNGRPATVIDEYTSECPAHPLRQRPGVHCPRRPGVAHQHRGKDPVH